MRCCGSSTQRQPIRRDDDLRRLRDPDGVRGRADRSLNSTLASFLATDTIAYGLPGDPVPDLTGLTTAHARTAATRSGYTFAVSDRVTDPQLAAGTVILQDPPAGTGIIGNEIDVLITQQPTPICQPGQLTVDYRGDGHGAGKEFANFFIRDTSRSACTLLGPVAVIGVNAAGHPVTDRETYPVGADVELSPNTAKVPYSAAVPAGAGSAGSNSPPHRSTTSTTAARTW